MGARTKRMQCDRLMTPPDMPVVGDACQRTNGNSLQPIPLGTAGCQTGRCRCGTTWANHTRPTHNSLTHTRSLSHTFSHSALSHLLVHTLTSHSQSQPPANARRSSRQSVEYPSSRPAFASVPAPALGSAVGHSSIDRCRVDASCWG